MFGIGTMEMLIIGGIAVLLFGKKLPDVAKNIGKTWKEFQEAINND